MMRPAEGPSLLPAKRAPGCAGALHVVWTLGAIVAALMSARPAGAQGTPDESPGVSISLPGRRAAAGLAYAGDEACGVCHQEKVNTYRRTVHAIASSVPSRDTIKGSFSSGANILRTVNPDLYFKMEASEKGFFQTAWLRTGPAVAYNRTERFDVVIGSGGKGQTYLFWDSDQLFQLPVSYWNELGEWVNSPGYPDGSAYFDRPTTPRCLECHATSFESHAPPVNQFKKTSLVLGISCERCHGPGGEHVVRFRAKPVARLVLDAAIINPAKLSRERQLDVCALCHAGTGNALAPPLSFVAGDVLDRYLVFPPLAPDARQVDHGNQVQFLERSRCFQSSTTLTCTTCHDVHTPPRDLAAYAVRCLSCHQVERCRRFPQLGHAIEGKCVTCHMPLEPSEQVVSSMNGRSVQAKVRNHQIGVFPEIHLP